MGILKCWNLKRAQEKAREKAKESREAKDKSYEDHPWTELCEDVTEPKNLRVPEPSKQALKPSRAEADFKNSKE